ncbi:MAG: AhpC/TSA family protein [Prevotellaceae bacterium]|jgi:peroxiredoxin|nr:AhpC/TSA family protein [Prevotellaceae bacterium]
MKKQLLSITCIFILLLSIFSACSNNSAVIKGNIKNADARKLYLEELNISVRKLIDSTKINAKGNFSFNYKFTRNEPSFIILRTDSVILANFLLERGETLNYTADYKWPGNYTVAGSEGSVLVKELNDQLAVISSKLDSLVRVLQKAEKTKEYDSINTQINYAMGAVVVKHKQSLIRFILQHPTSYASFTAIYQRLPSGISFFGKEKDILYYKTLVDSLSIHYPKSAYVQILNDDYQLLQSAISMQNLLSKAEVTEGTPELELPDTAGNMIKLSSLRGKVILIDFWSAVNPAMLMNNRELVDIYNKYNSRNFEIYQISEDTDNRDAWLQAINNQQLRWVCVMDTPSSYAALAYNVIRLPANYLIDEKGEIIGKNLFGENLDKKLNEILSRR